MQRHGSLFRMLACAGIVNGSLETTTPRYFEAGRLAAPLVAGTGFEPVTFRL